ncbi:C-terminal processing protease CtpA/Prc, contains a PDZ domain [Mucilaginibacter lappiensis]|uniref:C-terminal processing protease CtpA/Prc n=1 Tax=Mucilaginibacter lappiensis TaxID=354630 RepID=A0ABR6PTQ1_9SPHI|nr:S41 family peptidase [Mucilaginibacter lappiensis]MBB6112365.1 C-terminal processing protease CtpA/Prc [Mucilaginibacter lappiensis]SIS01347.1 C-terminal processing protease CtpA/Prc, contains a PDZ domain [Mucilaginibacter lappiensis]
MKKLLYLILFSAMVVVSACKKSDPGNNNNNNNGSGTSGATKLQLIQDSVYMIAQEDYYWNSFLPVYGIFNPRQYTAQSTDLLNLSQEIDAYTQLSKNPANGNLPYEYDPFNPGSSKYSFIDDGTVNKELNAVKGDFGFNYFYTYANVIRVSLVQPGSPAAAAGLQRSDQITSINGQTGNSIYITNLRDPANDAGYKYVSNAVNNGSTITLQILKTDGTQKTVTLNTKSYTVNPVIYTNTYALKGGKTAGYMVFNSFVGLSNIQARLDSVFNAFASKNVTDLIIDLRYNGGGDVETSIYLTNLIAPSSVSGSVMNTTYWSANMQNDKYPIIQKKLGPFPTGYFKSTNAAQIEKFSKVGSVNVNRVFFLVTGNTASASELTINNVKPKMNVQLIGDTTYGKPVGFLSNLTVNGDYFYTPEFETKNSNGEGGYYTGMPPVGSTATGGTYQGKRVIENIQNDFGDTNETLLSQAIGYIANGAYPTSSNLTVQSLSTNAVAMSDYQRKVLSVKTQSYRKNSMYLTLKAKK